MGMAMALFMEAFVSIHMSVFVLLPLSKMISRENSKKIFWILFWIRIAILLCFDFFITTGIAVVDFLAVFVGAFLVTPISIKKGIRITKGMKRFVKCFFELLTQALVSAAGNGTGKGAQNAPVDA